jgi:hypothetical protein
MSRPGSAAIASECSEVRGEDDAMEKSAGLLPQPSFRLGAKTATDRDECNAKSTTRMATLCLTCSPGEVVLPCVLVIDAANA